MGLWDLLGISSAEAQPHVFGMKGSADYDYEGAMKDKALRKMSDEEIWKKRRLWQHPQSKHWLGEIPDTDARVNLDGKTLEEVYDSPGLYGMMKDNDTGRNIKKIPTNVLLNQYAQEQGVTEIENNSIFPDRASKINASSSSREGLRDILTHEINHAIAVKYGLPRGGGTEGMSFQEYQDLPGEQLSRMATERNDYDRQRLYNESPLKTLQMLINQGR